MCCHCPAFYHSSLLFCCLEALGFVNFKKHVLFSVLQNIISSCEPEGVSEMKCVKNTGIKIWFCTSRVNFIVSYFFYSFLNLVTLWRYCHLSLIKWVTEHWFSAEHLLDAVSLMEGICFLSSSCCFRHRTTKTCIQDTNSSMVMYRK